MQEQIKSLVEQLHNLALHGSIEEARKFYWEKIHDFVEKRFIEQVEERIRNNKIPKYDWLILPVGLEVHYYVLLIKALKPKKVYFIGTEEFHKTNLDPIIKKSNLKREQYFVEVINYRGMDVAEVYGKIKEKSYLFEGKVAVDLTGGKRVISAGSAIMACFFGFDLIYIDEDWHDDIKRGIPGTEELVLVKNPFHTFGDLEKSYAKILFNQYSFDHSKEFYKSLCSKVIDPREYEVATLLSQSYYHWDSFNYNAALIKIKETIRRIEQYHLHFLDIKQLEKNQKTLGILNKINAVQRIDELLKDNELVLNLIIDLHSNALRRRENHALDDAIVRLYRLIELVSQYGLAKHNITTSNPDYTPFPGLKSKYSEITQSLYDQERNLPFEIGIKDGHIILFIIKDEIWKHKNIEDLKKFLGPIRLRDNSIIAHGLETINYNTFQKIQKICAEFIKKICLILNQNYEELIQEHKFIKL